MKARRISLILWTVVVVAVEVANIVINLHSQSNTVGFVAGAVLGGVVIWGVGAFVLRWAFNKAQARRTATKSD